MLQDTMVLLLPVLVLLVIALLIFRSNKKRMLRLQQRVTREWGGMIEREYEAGELEWISHYFRNELEKGKTGRSWIDDITWNDLEMDEFFMMLNHTYSSVGQEYLYRMLRILAEPEELEEREALIQYFMEHEDSRTAFQMKYAEIGRTRKISVSDYLKTLTSLERKSNLQHYLAIVLLLASVLLIPFQAGMGILALFLVVGINIHFYYKKRGEIEPYIVTLAHIMRMLRAGEDMLRLKEDFFASYFEVIRTAEKTFQNFKKSSKWVAGGDKMNGSAFDTILDYIRMLTHVDLIKFNSMLGEVQKHIDAIDALTETLGLLEACIAIASFRAGLPFYAVPEFLPYREGEQVRLMIQDMYHPLIEEPVANSIAAEKGVLITGSNASGKSTFLKTTALNAILAQTLHTCTAHAYQGQFFSIYSSMALRDDLGSKESYYIVEIKSLKRILNQIDPKKPLLCFVDEVLRGTNTVERIAASAQVLESLARPEVLCFAATHDIELTRLLEQEYDNYHFQEEIVGKDILFHYILQEGRATSRNAIRLLGMIGYDEAIIKDAQQTAEHFLLTGEWELHPGK